MPTENVLPEGRVAWRYIPPSRDMPITYVIAVAVNQGFFDAAQVSKEAGNDEAGSRLPEPVLDFVNPYTTREKILLCLNQPFVYSAVGSRSIARMQTLLGGPHLPDAQLNQSPSTDVVHR